MQIFQMMCNLCDESTRATLIPQINASMCTSVGTHGRVSASSVQAAALRVRTHAHTDTHTLTQSALSSANTGLDPGHTPDMSPVFQRITASSHIPPNISLIRISEFFYLNKIREQPRSQIQKLNCMRRRLESQKTQSFQPPEDLLASVWSCVTS